LLVADFGAQGIYLVDPDTASGSSVNTLKIVTPALNAGKYRIAVTNPDVETTSLDAGFTAN